MIYVSYDKPYSIDSKEWQQTHNFEYFIAIYTVKERLQLFCVTQDVQRKGSYIFPSLLLHVTFNLPSQRFPRYFPGVVVQRRGESHIPTLGEKRLRKIWGIWRRFLWVDHSMGIEASLSHERSDCILG